MVVKDGVNARNESPRNESRNESSPKARGNYLKRFQDQRPSNIPSKIPSNINIDCYHNFKPRSPPRSPRFKNTSQADSRSDTSYRPKRPQMSPRRVPPSNITTDCYHNFEPRSRPNSPRFKIKSQADSRSDASHRPQRPQMSPRRVPRKGTTRPEQSAQSTRSTMAVKNSRPMSDESSAKSSAAVKTQRSTRKPVTASKSKQKKTDPIPEKKQALKTTQKSRKSKGSQAKAKSTPLLSEERRDESDTKTRQKISHHAAYTPPALDPMRTKRQSKAEGKEDIRVSPVLSSPLAAAETKRKARAGMGRREPPDISYSIDSDTIREDKYIFESESRASEDPVMQNRTIKSTTDQSEGTYTGGTYTEYSRDTYNDTDIGDTTMDDDTYGGDTYGDDTMGEELIGHETFSSENTSSRRTHRSFLGYAFSKSLSENTSFGDGSIMIKQQVAWGCIGLSAFQFAILTTQVLLCGVAALSINPTLGPYPDAFSEWGGKNTYLLVEDQQYFRFITPIFLHVGYLHLIVNAFFQLETCAYLEREWGFLMWIIIYFIGGFGSCLAASAIDSNAIAVCSSGALMGLFGARISQAILWTMFETESEYAGQGTFIFERLGGVVCSASIVFALTFLTYIDWSGHLGGLCTGLLVGVLYFPYALKDEKTRSKLRCYAFAGMLVGGLLLTVVLFRYAQYDEELADACDYFRNLYSEGYTCECQAFS